MVLKRAATVLLTVLTLAGLPVRTAHAQALLLEAGEVAEKMAYKFEEDLRSAGFRLTPDDYKRIAYMEKHRTALLEMRKRLVLAERGANAANQQGEVAAMVKERKAVELMLREFPQPPSDADRKKGAPSYMDSMRNYSKFRAQPNENRVKTAAGRVEALEKKLEGLASGEIPAGGGGGGGKAGYTAIVTVQHQGQPNTTTEVFLNGSKLDRAKQEIRVGAAGSELRFRIVGIDARRKMIRDFVVSANGTVERQDDYGIQYSVRSGNFNGTTEFDLKREVYSWNPANVSPDSGSFKVADSLVAPKGLTRAIAKSDSAVLTFKKPLTCTFSAVGILEWARTSQLPSGARTGTEKGSTGVRISVQLLRN